MPDNAPCQLSTVFGQIDYDLTRSLKRRRTMEIHIRPTGKIQVYAPSSFTIPTIESFLKGRAQWMIKKVSLLRDREALRTRENTGCLYFGKSYPVRCHIGEEKWGRIDFDEEGWRIEIPGTVQVPLREQYSKSFLEKWFKGRAKMILDERVAHYARLMGEKPTDIRVRSPKRLWGSCHPTKRVLHFNWKIVMAPLEVIDYVVVHELSHIQAPDHSPRFWARVRKFAPCYKDHRDWLKQNGHQFVLALR